MAAPKGGGGQGQGNPDNAFAPLWMILIIGGAGYGIWYKAHTFIVTIVFHLQLFQIDIISYAPVGIGGKLYT